MNLALSIPAALLTGYVLGSLSPAYALGRLVAGLDIRTVNFRNAGVRNVKAALGLWPAVITAVIDTTKGVAALLLSERAYGLPETWAAVPVAAAVAGHILPFYLGFRGGKGTATAIGAFIYFAAVEIAAGAFAPQTFAAILLVALIMYAAARTGDVAGMATFFFMLTVTPLEMGINGASLVMMGLSLFILVSITRSSILHGVFRLEQGGEIKLWRIIARPLALVFIPIDRLAGRPVLLAVLGVLALAFAVTDVVRFFRRVRLPAIYKASEQRRVSSMTWFLAATFLSFLVFPDVIPYLALCFTVVGDLFGKLVGLRFGKTTLLPRRTLQGTLAFLGGSVLSAYLLSRIFPIGILFLAAGPVSAAAVELISGPVDDNLTVSLLSGGLLLALRTLFGG